MKRLFIIFTCLMVITCLYGCNKNNSKIEIKDGIEKYLDGDYTDFKEDEQIVVYIVCDYSKHEKYDEWIEKYNLKYSYESGRDKYLDHYDKLLNGACYELVKEKFKYGKFELMAIGEFLQFSYTSIEDFKKDYKEIKKISKQEYVIKIYITKWNSSIGQDE